MRTETIDPNVIIVKSASEFIRYERADTGQRWTVKGKCNQCGLCVIGASNADHYEWRDAPGRPLAVSDVRVSQRPDEPVTPEFSEAMRRMACVTSTAIVDGCSLEISAYDDDCGRRE